MEKLDYVIDFVRHVNTEIKYIQEHWYLHERSNAYDHQIGRLKNVKGNFRENNRTGAWFQAGQNMNVLILS